MTPGRTIIFVVLLVVCLAGIGAGLAFALSHHAGESSGAEHHGMSPGVWIAIFSGVWVPLLANAARRRRNRDKDKS